MSGEIVATAFWRRLDTEGHDCCTLMRMAEGWRLTGNAVFLHESLPCALAYSVTCDAGWHTRSARVHGIAAGKPLDLEIGRMEDGRWTLNGALQPKAGDCVDLDLAFTPATNLIAIRRLQPTTDVETAAPAAYYLEFTQHLGLVEQTYRRTGAASLAYAAPVQDYRAELTVHPSGFVTDYPGLWTGRVFG